MEQKSVSTNMVAGQQQYNLRWNNHTNNILQVFMEQLANEALVDVTLSCEGQFIKAHKMVLSACSPYFQELFRIHLVPHPVIIVNGMKYTDLKQVIDFMYRGEIKVMECELDSLLAVAESLQVKGLSSVRNNYEKEDSVSTNQQIISNEVNSECTEQTDKDATSLKGIKRKKSNDEHCIKSEDLTDDESLSSTIKIEPPEIKDIDQEDVIHVSDNEEQTFEQPKSQTGKPTRLKKNSRSKTATSFVPILPKSLQPVKTFPIQDLPIETMKISKVPRPPNAFMIFANEWRRKLASENPRESNKEISVRLGIMWKNLSSDAKENYYSMSRKADEEHKRKYPGYYYSPKEARLRKNMKALDIARNKRTLDAMHLVKLVMSEHNDNQRRRSSDHEKDESAEDENDDEMTGVNTSDEIDVEMREDNLKIDVENQNK